MQGDPALKGVNVVELAEVVVGPLICKALADYGATVIKVESELHPDGSRGGGVVGGGTPGVTHSALFPTVNTSKYGFGLNLNHPEAIPVLRQLVCWADVLVECYAPGVGERWGIAYEELRKIKPDIILVRGSMEGRTGPFAKRRGLGIQFQHTLGFSHLTGWPGQVPVSPHSPYPDFTVPWYALTAILAALDYRRRKGEGQYIDISQLEAGAQFLAPTLLDYVANGRAQSANGNRATYAAPHGVFRCKGDDKWCAIAVFTDDEWQALCSVIGNQALAEDPRFTTFIDRKRNEDELEKLVEEWTIQYEPNKVMTLLQAVGVAAGAVQDNRDLAQDPNFRQRRLFQTLNHPEIGECTFFNLPFRLSETPPQMRPSPVLCEHTEYVATKILGMSDDEFVRLLEAGVFK